MYSNEYLGINTNQDILKDTADLFPETYQTVNGYDNTATTFQNFTPSTNVFQGVNIATQPQTIITYQKTNLQPIKQNIHESLEPAVDPLTLIDTNSILTGVQGNTEATFETVTQEINPPQTTVQTTYEYIQPQTDYQNIKLPPQNLNQIITYTENPVNEFIQYDTAYQTQPVNETITKNITTQTPIVETKVLPSQIIQSPPTIETNTYQYSEPVVESGFTLQNVEQTQNIDVGGQYTQYVEEVSQVPDPNSYSLVPQPVIVPPPKPRETVVVKVPKIQKVIVPKIQKVIVPSKKTIVVRRPPAVGVSTVQTIPQPVPAALPVPANITTSTVRVPYSTASVQTPLVRQVPLPMASTVTVPTPAPATLPYSTGSIKVPVAAVPIASTQTVRVPYSAASVRVPYSVASVKAPVATAMPIASTQTVRVPITTPAVPVPATIPYSAASVRVPYSVASAKVPVATPVAVAPPRPVPLTAVATPVPAAVGIAPTMTSTIRPTLPVPVRPPVLAVPRPLPVAQAVTAGPVVAQALPYSTLSQRPLVANAAQPLQVAAIPPRPLVVPQAANLGMARPAIYNASTYNASTIRPVGVTLPATTGVVAANNNMMGNMAFQGRYNTKTYNARKL